MSSTRQHEIERRMTMNEVMAHHPAVNTWDPENTFPAEDVAVIPIGADDKTRTAAVQRTEKFLKDFGCLLPRRSATGKTVYMHVKSPLTDPSGLAVCDESKCIFHRGDKRGMIRTACPEEMEAAKRKGALTPLIVTTKAREPIQLTLL